MSHKFFTGFAAAFALSAALAVTHSVEAASANAAGAIVMMGATAGQKLKKQDEDVGKARSDWDGGICRRNDKVDIATARVEFEQCVEGNRQKSRMGLIVFLTAIGITGAGIVHACKR